MSAAAKFRTGCYVVEGVNSFATAMYCNYLYFYFHDRFGFNDRQNLLLAALAGLVYAFAAWQAGRFAQRRGCFTAMKAGFAIMAAAAGVSWYLQSAFGATIVACFVFAGACFVWPSLEALVSEGAPEEVPHAVGLYNITWALANAVAFFIGGTLIKKFGYGAIFGLPLVLMGLQFFSIFWLERIYPGPDRKSAGQAGAPAKPSELVMGRARNFQRLALVANPAAYIAINTLVAVLPGIAAKFELSTMWAGFALSLWCFARFITFIVLWRWTAWHYRFRWIMTAFAMLIISFAAILVAPSLWVVLLAQIGFGIAIGLIYYSSLFYSMDASESKGEHGGIHEAAIGIGNCLGPAIGASALWLAPANAGMGAWAVSGLLTLGFGSLFWIRAGQKPAREGARQNFS